jgi:hypothetical protein
MATRRPGFFEWFLVATNTVVSCMTLFYLFLDAVSTTLKTGNHNNHNHLCYHDDGVASEGLNKHKLHNEKS